MTSHDYPQVLLTAAVDRFEKLVGRFPRETIASGINEYWDPPLDLALQVVSMCAEGWRTDYEEVAALSGACALFGYQPYRSMPQFPYRELYPEARIAAGTGYGYAWQTFATPEQAWELIVAALDASHPVKSDYQHPLLFAGYQDAARSDDRRLYALTPGSPPSADWWSWGRFLDWVDHAQSAGVQRLGHHTRREPASEPREVAVRFLRELVTWSRQPPAAIQDRYPEVVFGAEGLMAYVEDCADDELYPEFLASKPVDAHGGLCNASAIYLTRVANEDLLPSGASSRMMLAAGHYRSAYCAWKEVHDTFWRPKLGAPINRTAVYQAGAEAARRAVRQEQAAIALLDRALAACS